MRIICNAGEWLHVCKGPPYALEVSINQESATSCEQCGKRQPDEIFIEDVDAIRFLLAHATVEDNEGAPNGWMTQVVVVRARLAELATLLAQDYVTK